MLIPRKKITRAELKRDPLMEAVYNTRQFGIEHRARIIKYGGGGLILLTAILIGLYLNGLHNEKAAAVSGMVAIDFSQLQYTRVIDRVPSKMEEFGGLPAFGPAVYFLARSELIVSDTLRAEEHFTLYIDDYGDDRVLRAGAYTGLGIIADSRGLHAQAGDFYRRASQAAETDFLRHSNAVHAGRSFILANEPKKAVKILRPLLDNEQFNRQLQGEAAAIIAQAEVVLGRI